MTAELAKLMLRAYNAESDNCARTLRPHTQRPGYHHKRLLEPELTADYLVKQEEEKDRIRAERERQKEEDAARRDFEREKTRLMKEQAHYSHGRFKIVLRPGLAAASRRGLP